MFTDLTEGDLTALLALLEKLNASIEANVELAEPHFPEE